MARFRFTLEVEQTVYLWMLCGFIEKGKSEE